MKQEDAIIIGAGPCGLAAAIALQNKGMSPLIIEKGNIVNAIYNYPTHQQFFSSSEKLAIGNIPFYSIERKPKRNEALVYYRQVAEEKDLKINAYEKVVKVTKNAERNFTVQTKLLNGSEKEYSTKYLIIATGYYDSPNYMNIEGEDQPHVFHYFKEAHPFYGQHTAVIGGKNSAVDAALELEKAGAKVTVYYRRAEYSKSIKPWILPEFDGLVRNGRISMHFNTEIEGITENSIIYRKDNQKMEDRADFVFAMTGYHPDHSFLKEMGVEVETETGRPVFNEETMETNVENIFIAGVIAAGNNANEIFIENGRFHGGRIAVAITGKERSR